MNLVLELNSKHQHSEGVEALAKRGLLITPPLGGDTTWLYRVKVSEKQSIVGFPKFGMVGIGFHKEDADWNTNLPSGRDAKEIFNHIKHNKGDDSIPNQRCIQAIKIIQQQVNNSG